MSRLTEMLTRHEGKKSHVYQDTKKIWTIAIGRNVDKDHNGPGLSDDEMEYMLENDIIKRTKALARTYPWFGQLDEVRQDALIDMSFMGLRALGGFGLMMKAFEEGDYEEASVQAVDSKWAKKDVAKSRSEEIAFMIRTGRYMPNAT